MMLASLDTSPMTPDSANLPAAVSLNKFMLLAHALVASQRREYILQPNLNLQHLGLARAQQTTAGQ